MSVPAPSPPRQEPPESLRARILREATRLFAERGYAATSVREITMAAGCTKPALYYHFGGKEQLFLQAIRHETEGITRLIFDVTGGDLPVRDLIARGLETFVEHVHRNPMGMRLLMRAELWPDEGQPEYDFESLRATHLELIKGLLARGVEEKSVRPDVDLEDAAYALAGIIDQRLQLWLRGEPVPADFPARAVSIFFDGVAAR
ncbi:MAG: TetR/AcrR family transcriptional regulator [Myxococcales bacterium]|jgi:AcrR family transcriptional regulator|nr:TetR/AcrR family transcriptional regulator [Myxococcales bacterium]